MANESDEKEQTLPAAIERKREHVSHKKSRLPIMPLAVLLPSLGEVSELHRFASNFEKRLAALQEEPRYFSKEGEGQLVRLSEESMLNQVVQWLAVGSGSDE